MAFAAAGLGIGVVAALPFLFAQNGEVSLAKGIVALLLSFTIVMLAIVMAKRMIGEAFIGFSVLAILTFLAIITVSVLKRARALN